MLTSTIPQYANLRTKTLLAALQDFFKGNRTEISEKKEKKDMTEKIKNEEQWGEEGTQIVDYFGGCAIAEDEEGNLFYQQVSQEFIEIGQFLPLDEVSPLDELDELKRAALVAYLSDGNKTQAYILWALRDVSDGLRGIKESTDKKENAESIGNILYALSDISARSKQCYMTLNDIRFILEEIEKRKE